MVITDWIGAPAPADSALPLLSGFDVERVEAIFPADADDQIGELAKLIYRLRQVSPESLESRVDSDAKPQLGDAVRFSGVVQSIRSMEVPAKLAEFLEFEQLSLLTVVADDRETAVVTLSVDPKIEAGDRVAGTGVAIERSSQQLVPSAIAVTKLRWFPEQVPNAGWQMLRDAGVDVSLIAGLTTRNRRPLVDADGDAFYAMLAAAASLSNREDLTDPVSVRPVDMLQDPEDLSGQWIEIDLETVQITRVSVTEPYRQNEIGSDHYYQVDAVGDLGNVVIKIEPSDPAGQPALFQGRYPVSMVTPTLPEFLQRQVVAKSGNDAVVTQLHTKIAAQAFFYRLWSYQSEFMNHHGSGSQLGPLLVAVSISDREPARTDVPGVGVIGTIAAVAVIAAIIVTFLWHRKTAAADRAARVERQQRESQRVDFPSSST